MAVAACGNSTRALTAAIALSCLLSGCGGSDGSGSGSSSSSAVAVYDAKAPSTSLAVPGPTPTPAAKPNILFIIADDLRPQIGAYGAPIVQTPNIDAFAATGALFKNSYVSMSLCAPSRYVLMTGLRPDTSGMTSNSKRLDDVLPSATTMMDQFLAAGYNTESIGKVYHFQNDDANGWTYQFRWMEDYFDKSAGPTTDPTRLVDTRYEQKAVERLGILKTNGKPFFMAVGFRRPHLPYLAPPSDWARYTSTNLPTPRPPQTGAPYWALLTYEHYQFADLAPYSKDQFLPPNFPPEVNSYLTIGYLASVSYLDGLVGALLGQLQALGLDKNTIVVLWGDNGYKVNDYGYWSKGSNADIDIRVPLIIRAPGRTQAGSKIDGLVEAVDLYPTLAELAGLPARSDLEGQSFVKLLDSPQTQWKSAAFAQFADNTADGPMWGSTVRTARYRYTAWVTSGRKIYTRELYDHDTDPDELKNVATDKSYKQVVDELERIRVGGGADVRAELRKRLKL